MVSLEFFSDIILPVAPCPWGRLSLQQKWVPSVFPGSKGGRCVRLTTLPPSCAVVMKSGNLKFLEPSGPLQACNGTDLPVPLQRTISVQSKQQTRSGFSKKKVQIRHSFQSNFLARTVMATVPQVWRSTTGTTTPNQTINKRRREASRGRPCRVAWWSSRISAIRTAFAYQWAS